MEPALNRNWWGGMETAVCHLADAFLIKVLQILRGQQHGGFLLRTRLRQLRMYSMAVGLDSQIYSSSSAATVLPTVKSLSDMKDSTLNSIALRTF